MTTLVHFLIRVDGIKGKGEVKVNEKGVEDIGIKMYNDLVHLTSLIIIYNKTVIQQNFVARQVSEWTILL